MDASKPRPFFRYEAERSHSYNESVQFGLDILGRPPSADRSNDAINFLNHLSLIPFYNLDDSLLTLSRARGRLMSLALAGLIKQFYPSTSSILKTRILAIKPNLNRGPELASTFSHLLPCPRGVEVWIGCFTPPSLDILKHLDAHGIRVVLLKNQFDLAMRQIVSLAPAIIVYMTNQAAVMNHAAMLGCFRLAPIQVATTMSPVTTGLTQIDFYLTGMDNEVTNIQSRYLETPLLIPGDINVYDPAGLVNSDFHPAEHDSARQNFFFAGGNFNKYNAPLLQAWARILSYTDSRLVLAPYNPNWQASYERVGFEQWVRGQMMIGGVDPSRIEFVGPFPDRSSILELVRSCKLYLDTFPYSGAVSLVDAIDTQTPFLCLEGSQARFRQGALQARRYPEIGTIANSVSEYVEFACNFCPQTSRPHAAQSGTRSGSVPKLNSTLSASVYEALYSI
jgi:hypothetical protein